MKLEMKKRLKLPALEKMNRRDNTSEDEENRYKIQVKSFNLNLNTNSN